MDVYSIIGISISFCFAGIGIALGARLFQLQRASNKTGRKRDKLHREAHAKQTRREAVLRRRLHRPTGTLRQTSIHGINERGWLRHTDGSYTRAFRVEMPATLYADDGAVDRIYNDFARTLQSINMAA